MSSFSIIFRTQSMASSSVKVFHDSRQARRIHSTRHHRLHDRARFVVLSDRKGVTNSRAEFDADESAQSFFLAARSRANDYCVGESHGHQSAGHYQSS